jgi:hypothetical protein
MRKRFLKSIGFVLALAAIAFAADDPFVGTWKMNMAKSKFDPGPPPKSASIVIQAQDNDIKISGKSVDANSKAARQELAPKFDGKDYPYTGTGEAPDITVAQRRIDAKTIDEVIKRGGKEMQRGHLVVSTDGRTLTRTVKGKDERGQDLNNVTIYEKQ